ncbi:hypothetical protein Tco_1422009 [Tanacetum coccineum]
MNWVRARYGNVNDITKERILQNFWNNKLGGQTREKTITEEQEDPERCGETKIKPRIGAMVNKLPKEWFSGVSRDMDDLEGIIDYLEPTLYDGFIDHNDEAYKQRKNRLLGMPYTEPPPIIKEEAKITKYNLGAEWENDENNETLSLERKNGSRFSKMIMEEMEEVLENDGEDSDDET